MAVKRLGLISPGPFLLLLTIILLLYTSVDAIRLPPFDELNPSTGISKPLLTERQESTEHLPTDHESTDHEPVIVAKKKKPQVIRLGIKHEEHGTSYLPLPAQQPTTCQRSRRGQQQMPEDYYSQRLGTREQSEDRDDHPNPLHDILSQGPYDQSTVDPVDGSPDQPPREPHCSTTTVAQKSIHLARRGLELMKRNCFLPDPAGNKCYINKCHCVTYDTDVGSEFGPSTGECWCPMIEVGRSRSKREISSETEKESYQKYRNSELHKRGLRGRAQLSSDHLFVNQLPHNMEQGPGYPKIYKREPEPLPAGKKKNKGKGNSKQLAKCKGGKCNKGTKKQQTEGKKGKSRINRRNAYMYREQHRDFELEL
ncbi:hypothetical protein EV426DRAFT_706694 [Tirmania nivea]|nr:hypothetical protein EV426DRAFT_706694 [Tirmania nivea]